MGEPEPPSPGPGVGAFIPGLQLARRFFHEVVAPRLERLVPALAYGAALIGDGSEVLGCDDAISTDLGRAATGALTLAAAETTVAA